MYRIRKVSHGTGYVFKDFKHEKFSLLEGAMQQEASHGVWSVHPEGSCRSQKEETRKASHGVWSVRPMAPVGAKKNKPDTL